MTTSDLTPALTSVVLVGTLNPSPAPSSSELIGRQVLSTLAPHGVTGSVVRLADHDICPGVQVDMGEGDVWPTIRRQILAADILVLATPIWMGQPSSVTKRALERLDAELSEKDGQSQLLTYEKAAVVAVVGNGDGAHHVSAEAFQALDDVGFTLPASAVTYWVGPAMATVDYRDLDETPPEVVRRDSDPGGERGTPRAAAAVLPLPTSGMSGPTAVHNPRTQVPDYRRRNPRDRDEVPGRLAQFASLGPGRESPPLGEAPGQHRGAAARSQTPRPWLSL